MKQVNRQALAEGVSFIALAVVWLIFMGSGTYRLFIAPRLLPFLSLAVVFFLLWGGVTLFLGRRPTYRQRYRNCLIMLIPAVLLLGPVCFGGQRFSGHAAAEMMDEPQASTHPFGIDFDGLSGSGIDEEHRVIIMNTKNYYANDLELTKNIEKYQGYTVYALGFVSYDDEMLKGNDFTIARYLMFCCINDITPFGLTCQYDGTKRWTEFQWVAVKGTVSKRPWHGLMQPIIVVQEIMPARKVEGYIYP